MAQYYTVPNIYQDISNQSQGYFAFRFICQQCYWSVDTSPIRSTVSTATNIMDIGVGLLGGFWGRAAEAGEKIYGSKWHTEQADALQKSWGQIQHEFRFCPKCHRTVCLRCFNLQLNLCNGSGCALDLKADGIQYQHQMNIEAQREQIQQNYQAPQFNVHAIPSAATPDLAPPQQAHLRSPHSNVPISDARASSEQTVMCPKCRRMGPAGKFCQDCGCKLPLPASFCPQCASTVENTARFCPECGTKLQMAT